MEESLKFPRNPNGLIPSGFLRRKLGGKTLHDHIKDCVGKHNVTKYSKIMRNNGVIKNYDIEYSDEMREGFLPFDCRGTMRYRKFVYNTFDFEKDTFIPYLENTVGREALVSFLDGYKMRNSVNGDTIRDLEIKWEYFTTSANIPIVTTKMLEIAAADGTLTSNQYFFIRNGQVIGYLPANGKNYSQVVELEGKSDEILMFPADVNLQGYAYPVKQRCNLARVDTATQFALWCIAADTTDLLQACLFKKRRYSPGVYNNLEYSVRHCGICGNKGCLSTKLLAVCPECISMAVLGTSLDWKTFSGDLSKELVKTAGDALQKICISLFSTSYYMKAVRFAGTTQVKEQIQAGENLADMCYICHGPCHFYGSIAAPPDEYSLLAGKLDNLLVGHRQVEEKKEQDTWGEGPWPRRSKTSKGW